MAVHSILYFVIKQGRGVITLCRECLWWLGPSQLDLRMSSSSQMEAVGYVHVCYSLI